MRDVYKQEKQSFPEEGCVRLESTIVDRTICVAFDNLIQWAEDSALLSEIAAQPNGRQERTVSNHFRNFLYEQGLGDVLHEETRNYAGQNYRHDIVAMQNSEVVTVVEVKTPFTNHDGIRNKTRKSEHLPKDMDALKAALCSGATTAYDLVTPIGCYPVDSNGRMIVLNPNSIRSNEKEVKVKYKIQWPTRPDYEFSREHGKRQVDRAIVDLAGERNLNVRRIRGWQRVDLPNPRPDVNAFVDCALYKVN